MKTKKQSNYEQRGVSARKEGVHKATKNLDKGLFPGAFCTVLPDHLGVTPSHPKGDPKMVNVMHADGEGTKPVISFLAMCDSGDIHHFRGNAQGSLVMNTDDVGCVGATGPFLVTQNIGRNRALIPDSVVAEIIAGCKATCERLSDWGVTCVYAGGETADLGDSVRTVTIDNAVTVRFPKEDVIDASKMRPHDYIVGLSSTGQAPWEDDEVSDMGSNGLTNARHDTLHPRYKFLDTYCPQTPKKLVYTGKYWLNDTIPGLKRTVAWGLLSPTRTYLPLLRELFRLIARSEFHGIIHCSGGGQTKIGKFGRPGNVYLKTNPFPVSPWFAFLRDARKLSWHEMYEAYNMGHRMELVVPRYRVAQECIRIARNFGIDAQIIGRVEAGRDTKHRRVVIKTKNGNFRYKFKV